MDDEKAESNVDLVLDRNSIATSQLKNLKALVVASQVASRKLSIEDAATSSNKKDVTSESRWIGQVEEQDEHVIPHRKLSLKAPIFVPKRSGIGSCLLFLFSFFDLSR